MPTIDKPEFRLVEQFVQSWSELFGVKPYKFKPFDCEIPPVLLDCRQIADWQEPDDWENR